MRRRAGAQGYVRVNNAKFAQNRLIFAHFSRASDGAEPARARWKSLWKSLRRRFPERYSRFRSVASLMSLMLLVSC